MLSLAMVPMSLLASNNLQVNIPWDFEQIKADSKLLAEEENRIFKDLKFHTPASRAQYITFWTIQALDVYSTYRGLQYNCVREANPLLGENPGIGHMVTHKTVFLYPFYTLPRDIIDRETMQWVNGFGTVVIINNYEVWNRAHKQCIRR